MRQINRLLRWRAGRPEILLFAAFIVATLLLFWSLVVDGRILAFRDSLHFYFPLWQSLDARTGWQWWLPQFNYLDRIGSSIIGEPTSGIFYPLRPILATPWLTLPQRIGLLIWLHFPIALIGCYVGSRRVLRLSKFAAIQICLIYSLGGPLLLSIYNPPYLFSAAWLPISLFATFSILTSHHKAVSIRCFLSLSGSLIAMILAGDFELPYNVAISAFAMTLFLCIHRRRQPSVHSFRRLFVVCLSFLIAIGCSSIQLIPTFHWLNVGASELALSSRVGVGDRFTLQAYDWLTMLIPFANGNYTPQHTRWVAAWDSSPMWIASLHFFALGVAAVLIMPRTVGVSHKIRAWIVIAIVATLSAAGRAGGLYLLFESALPYYQALRFPMKWWPIAALSLAICVGLTLELAQRKSKLRATLLKALISLATINLAVFIYCSIILFREQLRPNIFELVPPEQWCGGFDATTTIQLVMASSGVTALSSFAAWLSIFFRNRSSNPNRHYFGSELHWIGLFQLTFLAWLSISTIDPQLLDASPGPPLTKWDVNPAPIAIFESTFPSSDSPFYKGPATALESAKFQQSHLAGKMHLLAGVRNLDAQLSIEPPIYARGISDLNWLDSKFIGHLPNGRVRPEIKLSNESIEIYFEQNESDHASKLQLPILNDGGWYSEEASIVDSGDQLQVVLAPNGKHVKLIYRTPGLLVGALLSLSTLFITSLGCWTVNYVRNAARRSA